MNQETKEDTINESDKKMEKTNLSDPSYNNGLEATTEQIRLFEENVKKITEVVDGITFSSNLEKLKNCEESTKMTLKAMENSARFNIINLETLNHLKEIRETYFELNQEAIDVPNVSIVSQSALLGDMDIKMDAAINFQKAYIESLENELNKKEEEMRQLKLIIDENKRQYNV